MSRNFVLALVLTTGLFGGLAVAADDDYEFGMAISSELQFDDWAEKYFQKLQKSNSKTTQQTGNLGLASMVLKKADIARRNRRAEDARKLYQKAKKMFSSFLERTDNHPNLSNAMRAISEIERREVKALMAVSKASKDNRLKAKYKKEAIALMQKVLVPLRELKVKARKDFDDADKKEKSEAIKMALLDKAMMAMQEYYNVALDMGTIYDKKSRESISMAKKLVVEMDADNEYYDMMGYALISLNINYYTGRAHALGNNIERAIESYDLATSFDTGPPLPRAAREWGDIIRLRAYYLKAQLYLEEKKYEDVVRAVGDMFAPVVGFPDALAFDEGNQAMITLARAHAHTNPPDFEAAVVALQKIINDKRHPQWASNADSLLNEINQMAGGVAISDPAMLHRAALGQYADATAQKGAALRKGLEKTILAYKSAIRACHDLGIDYKKRLQVEPTAWWQLALVYYKLGLWYEARFAFEAVVRYFAKDVVGKKLAEMKEFKGRIEKIEKGIKMGRIKSEVEGGTPNKYAVLFDEAMEKSRDKNLRESLKIVETRLKKCAINVKSMAQKQHKITKSTFDSAALRDAIVILYENSPDTREEAEFHIGLLERGNALELIKGKKLKEGIAKLEEVGGMFSAAAQKLPARREIGHYLAATVYYSAMSYRSTMNEPDKDVARLAAKAIESFKAFENEANKAMRLDDTTNVDNEVLVKARATRKKRMGNMYVSRPAILKTLKRYKEAIKAVEAFIARDGVEPKQRAAALRVKLRSLEALAMDSLGKRAENASFATLKEFVDTITGTDDYRANILTEVAGVFFQASNKLLESANVEGADKAALETKANKYKLEFADYMAKVIEIKGSDDIGEQIRIGETFYKLGVYEGAYNLLKEVLVKEDADGTGIKNKIDTASFEGFAKNLLFEDEKIQKKAEKSIKALRELIDGEKVVYQDYTDGTKEALPSKKRNWIKAYKIISALEKNKVVKNKAPEELLVKLADAKKELAHRLQILRVKLKVADCAIALATQETDSAKSKRYWQEAADSFEQVRKYYWRDNGLRVEQAKALRALGKIREARQLYIQVVLKSRERLPSKNGVGTGALNPVRFDAQKAISFLTFQMAEEMKATNEDEAKKLFKKAKGFPFQFKETSTGDVKDLWPEIDEYLAKIDAAIEELGGELANDDLAKKIAEENEKIKGKYDNEVSKEDESLKTQLIIIENQIKDPSLTPPGKTPITAETRAVAQKEAFELHITTTPKLWLDQLEGEVNNRTKKKAKANADAKKLLIRFIYQSPFTSKVLREQAERLGVLKDKGDGAPLKLLSKKTIKKAIEVGLLTKDGKLRSASELDLSLLKRSWPMPEGVNLDGTLMEPADDMSEGQ